MNSPSQTQLRSNTSTAHSDIWQVARSYAYEGYLGALLAPRNVRDDLVVLAAFLGEMARIPFLVSEPTLGDIRLQWWRDWLAGLGAQATPTGNQLADAFGQVIIRHHLPRDQLDALLDARGDDGYPTIQRSLSEYEAYLQATTGSGLSLAARICGIEATPAFNSLIANATEAVGTVVVLRRLPRHVSREQWPLPITIDRATAPLQSHTLLPDDFIDNSATERQASIVSAIQSARAAHRRAKSQMRAASKAERGIILELALVEPYLRVLDDPNFDPTRQVAEISPLAMASRVLIGKWFGRC
ncbi:MAG: squalene/phytoene synthase family protein [Hyphomicrobiaceae bacterium]